MIILEATKKQGFTHSLSLSKMCLFGKKSHGGQIDPLPPPPIPPAFLGLNQKEMKTYQEHSLILLQNLLHSQKMLYRRHKQNMRIHC